MDISKVKVELDPLALDTEDAYEERLYCCQVCNLIQIGFSKFSAEVQSEIIREGRPTPRLYNMIFINAKGQPRYFNYARYSDYEWLTGCEKRARLFCWPCLMFSDKQDCWSSTGVADLNNIPYTLKRHSIWQNHIESMIKWKTFGRTVTELDSDEDDTLESIENERRIREEKVLRNREMMKKLTQVACFLSVHEVCSPLEEGGGEPTDPIDQVKYENFLNFVSKYDAMLEKQLSLDEQFMSSTVRRHTIESMYKVVSREVVNDIKKTLFVSMILDEVAELEDTLLVSTILRYVDAKGELRERFLNFREIRSDRMADSLFDVISENVNFYNCSGKLISLSCDGGIVQTSELFNLKEKVKNICPRACFLHYYEHRINSVLAQSLSTIKQCKHFFFTLNSLAAFFFKSKELSDRLNNTIRKSKPIAPDFRWGFNGALIKNVLEIRQSLIELFDSIVERNECFDTETVMTASRFSRLLTNDLSFNMLLVLLGDVFLEGDKLSITLTASYDNISIRDHSLKKFTNFIKARELSFTSVYSEASCLINSITIEAPSKKIKLEDEVCTDKSSDTCRALFDSVIYNILAQLHSRFNDLSKLTFLPLIDFKNDKRTPEKFAPLTYPFEQFFDVQALETELNVLFDSKAFKTSSLRDIVKYLKYLDSSASMPMTLKLCELCLTLPLSKGNSTLERIGDYIQSSTSSHRLSSLAMLKIEKELVDDLGNSQKFFDDVIQEFSLMEPSIPLHYIK